MFIQEHVLLGRFMANFIGSSGKTKLAFSVYHWTFHFKSVTKSASSNVILFAIGMHFQGVWFVISRT